jgi:hypothetical protein
MSGCPISFGSQRHEIFASNAEITKQLGRHLGKLHSTRDARWGNFPQTESFPPGDFPQRLAHTLQQLSSYGCTGDIEVQKSLHLFMDMAKNIPPPNHISLIMPDINPSQFLVEGNRITALIDIESYVRGPIELELTIVELLLTDGIPFRQGYEEVRGCFPSLDQVRTVYRFFLYLLFNAPLKGIANWTEAPIRFQ